jgi:zinc transporter ZupT
MSLLGVGWVRVLVAATATAVATGIGALPFFFFKHLDRRVLGWAGAVAAGIMLAASFRLINEGIEHSLFSSLLGAGIGLVFIAGSRRLMGSDEKVSVGRLKGANALRAILVFGVMAVHSFAEGVGVGVSFGGRTSFGLFIALAIAVHNIPEGLAISLVLVPRGVAPWKAMLLSIVSSLPQPLIGVPAYLFVEYSRPFLPVGLGIAGGAMIWMVVSELLPDAFEQARKKERVASIVVVAVAAMMAFQVLVEV